MTWTETQTKNYEQTGIEYDALVNNVRSAKPSKVEAETALGRRLLDDVGDIVRVIYQKKISGLPRSRQYDCRGDADDTAIEFAAFILEGVRAGSFETGRNILGFRKYLRPMVRRRANEEIEKALNLNPIYLENEEGTAYENPAIHRAQSPQVRLLPFRLLDCLTERDRCVLAALDAYGNDREATAAYFGMKIGTFNTYISRIRNKILAYQRNGKD